MKQISTRFSMAVHILALIASHDAELTGEHIAGSINTNPVVVRRIIAMLKRAGLVNVRAGIGGASLSRPPEAITLLDIYRAVDLIENNQLFGVHEQSNPLCEIGRNIENVLRCELDEAQRVMEERLARTTLRTLIAKFQS